MIDIKALIERAEKAMETLDSEVLASGYCVPELVEALKEAEDECKRLEAERDALRADLEIADAQARYWEGSYSDERKEVDALRAEVEDLKNGYMGRLKSELIAENDTLRAQLRESNLIAKALNEKGADAQAENEKLRMEVAVARDRLGPGGYQMLTEMRELRVENEKLWAVMKVVELGVKRQVGWIDVEMMMETLRPRDEAGK
jgi:hypothetical protein